MQRRVSFKAWSMASADQTVRVFISSTFRDMNAERDHLVTVVFPELCKRVERLGIEFFDVDLRWGVPAKDANGETANSCEYCRNGLTVSSRSLLASSGSATAGCWMVQISIGESCHE